MLILQRKAGESLFIGDDIRVTVVSVEAGGRVRLAIDAPRSLPILRSELRVAADTNQAAAKEEVGKPFLYEEELRSKNARLVELDTLLNIDGKGQAHAEAVVTKSARPSVLDHLKRPATPRSTDKKPKQHEEVR